MQYIYYKSLYVWEGDCGSSGGATGAPVATATRGYRANAQHAAGPTRTGGSSWRPMTIDTTSYNSGGKYEF
jgi:hypothetical protein